MQKKVNFYVNVILNRNLNNFGGTDMFHKKIHHEDNENVAAIVKNNKTTNNLPF